MSRTATAKTDSPTDPGQWIENPLDCWITPQWIEDLRDRVWRGPADLDPFWDPASIVAHQARLDIRKGEDAYDLGVQEVVNLIGELQRVVRVWMNGPYSGRNPQRTASLAAEMVTIGDPVSIMNLCPAAPGSEYWAEHVWPFSPTVAWLGRVSFVAGRDLLYPDGHAKAGLIKYHAGETVDGNRTEIALVHTTTEPLESEIFRRVFSLAGYHVTRG